MKIRLHDDVFLYSDERQWIIGEEVVKKDGKHRVNSMYFPTASGCIRAYYEKYKKRRVKYLDEDGKEKEISLNELFKALKDSEESIKKLSKDIEKKLVKA